LSCVYSVPSDLDSESKTLEDKGALELYGNEGEAIKLWK